MHALNHVIFFKSFPELSLANSTKDGEAARAGVKARGDLANMDKVIWKQGMPFSKNEYYPKAYMGWRMTVSVHQLSRKGSEDYSMPQAELVSTHPVPEKRMHSAGLANRNK